jgi:hypothetical protein
MIEANGGAAFFESILASQHLCLFAKMLSKNAAPPFVASMIEATVATTVIPFLTAPLPHADGNTLLSIVRRRMVVVVVAS